MNEQVLKFELTLDEANVILKALGQLPYEAVESLIPKLKEQGESQLKPAEEVAPVEEEVITPEA